MALTRRQQIFVAEYCTHSDGKKAALAAGYSPKSAESQASQLLKNPKVSEEISQRTGKVLRKLDISAERVLQQLGRVAFFDSRAFFKEDGSLRQVTELDDDTAVALAGIEHEKLYDHFGKGQAQDVGTTSKIKLADRLRALELLGKHLKLFTDKLEVSGIDGLAERLQKARASR